MMNWTQMTQNMFKSLMDTQQMMWETMTDTAKSLTGAQPATVWEQGIGTWEKAVNTMLETQASWIQTWGKTMTGMMQNDAAANFAPMMLGMIDSWIKMQQIMWNNWFAVVRRLDPSKAGNLVQSDSMNVVEAWQKQIQDMTTMQQEWMNKFTTMLTPNNK